MSTWSATCQHCIGERFSIIQILPIALTCLWCSGGTFVIFSRHSVCNRIPSTPQHLKARTHRGVGFNSRKAPWRNTFQSPPATNSSLFGKKNQAATYRPMHSNAHHCLNVQSIYICVCVCIRSSQHKHTFRSAFSPSAKTVAHSVVANKKNGNNTPKDQGVCCRKMA